jgi:hypothetical protein
MRCLPLSRPVGDMDLGFIVASGVTDTRAGGGGLKRSSKVTGMGLWIVGGGTDLARTGITISRVFCGAGVLA